MFSRRSSSPAAAGPTIRSESRLRLACGQSSLPIWSSKNFFSDASARGSVDEPLTGSSVVPTIVDPCHGMANSTRPSAVLGIISAVIRRGTSAAAQNAFPGSRPAATRVRDAPCDSVSSAKTPQALIDYLGLHLEDRAFFAVPRLDADGLAAAPASGRQLQRS